jgi:mevalonate kinase
MSQVVPSQVSPTFQAQGKVILLGEHAVVYGVPALAVGIDKGVRTTRTVAPNHELCVPAWGMSVLPSVAEDAEPLARAFSAILVETERHRAAATPAQSPFRVEAEVHLPPGGGLGCSAALGVAVARALDPDATESEIAQRVMAWERVFHGNPSGVDAAVSASGGCVYFRRGAPIERVAIGAPILLCVGHSGVASSTKSMVDAVARLAERRPDVAQKTWDGIRALVENAKLAVQAGDHLALGRLMDLNQMLLSGLFLSSTEIEQMCALARSAGALGAKLTGAGGGGSVVALVPSPEIAQKVLFAWQEAGYTSFFAQVAAAPAVAMQPVESTA